jgi:hypothetical protein
MLEGIQGKFSKKVLRIPRNAAKGAPEMEVARDSRRGKILCAEIECWIMVKQSAEVESMSQGYDWQVGQPRVECWDRRVRKELDTVGCDYILQNARETEIRSMCHIIKLRCPEIQRQSWLAEMREERILSIYGDLKHCLGREDYTTCRTVNERRNWHNMVQAGNLREGGRVHKELQV